MTSTTSLVPSETSLEPAATRALRYVADAHDLVGGNRVALLRNGRETFPAWLAAIDAARERVSLEMYIFHDDSIGRRFAEALMAAAARGVTVRLLYDFVGCRDTPASFFQQMRAGGVHTIAYHKYRFWRPRFWGLIRRNHRKTLVCDGTVAFTGGVNIADAWVAREDGGGGWRDATVRVEGPAVAILEEVFLRTWNRRARKRWRLPPEKMIRPGPAGETRIAVISNKELLDRFAIRRASLFAIRESRVSIFLANPYFVPDRGILRGLQEAAARGVVVNLLVPAHSDSRILDLAARATFGPLLAAGVRIWMTEEVIHTKALAVDDDFVSLGSYNLDHRSLAYNLEVVVNALDVVYTAAVKKMLQDDMGASTEMTLATYQNRSLLERLLERLAYSLRRWL